MSKKILMKGNEAIGKAAILAGCDVFFGYPITPQNEIPEYLSVEMKKNGKVFVQSESEVATINMLYGAGGAGAKTMTSSSSVGIALMQEGISYLAAAQVPAVIVSVMRAGPGIGGIQSSQADYFQATRGGGNGDYKTIVYTPSNIQEAINITKIAFDCAFHYRVVVMILIDGLIGQMMEPVDFNQPLLKKYKNVNINTWATTGTQNHSGRNVINSLFLNPYELEESNKMLQKKYADITKNEIMVETSSNINNAQYVIVSFGTMSRIVKDAIIEFNKTNKTKIGFIRPITVWPFPSKSISSLKKTCKGILVCEMNMGQMIDDVRIANTNQIPVSFFGRCGGVIPEIPEVVAAITKMVKGGKK